MLGGGGGTESTLSHIAWMQRYVRIGEEQTYPSLGPIEQLCGWNLASWKYAYVELPSSFFHIQLMYTILLATPVLLTYVRY